MAEDRLALIICSIQDEQRLLRMIDDNGYMLSKDALHLAIRAGKKMIAHELIWRGCPRDEETLHLAVAHRFTSIANELIAYGCPSSIQILRLAVDLGNRELAFELATRTSGYGPKHIWLDARITALYLSQIESPDEYEMYMRLFVEYAAKDNGEGLIHALFDTEYVPTYDVLQIIVNNAGYEFLPSMLNCARDVEQHLRKLMEQCECRIKRQTLDGILLSYNTPKPCDSFHTAVMDRRLNSARLLINDGTASESTFLWAMAYNYVETAKRMIVSCDVELTADAISKAISMGFDVELIPLLLAANCPKSKDAIEIAIQHESPKLAMKLIEDDFPISKRALENAIWMDFPKLALEMHSRGCEVSENVQQYVVEWTFEGLLLGAGRELRMQEN